MLLMIWRFNYVITPLNLSAKKYERNSAGESNIWVSGSSAESLRHVMVLWPPSRSWVSHRRATEATDDSDFSTVLLLKEVS